MSPNSLKIRSKTPDSTICRRLRKFPQYRSKTPDPVFRYHMGPIKNELGSYDILKNYFTSNKNSLKLLMVYTNQFNSRSSYENAVSELKIRYKDAAGLYRRIIDDKDLGLIVVSTYPWTVQHLSPRLRKDKNFIKDCIRSNGKSYRHLSISEKLDYENIILVIKSLPIMFRYLPLRYRDDTWLSELAIINKISNVKYISERLSSDRNMALMVSKMSYTYFKYFDYKFLNDKEIVINLAKRKGFCLDHMPYHMRNDQLINSIADNNKYSIKS